MKIVLDLPEATVAKYESQAPDGSAGSEMCRRLTSFANVPVDDRALVISGDNRRKLEAAFQTTLDDFDKLYQLVTNMNSLKIGPVERAFSVDELARLREQAHFHGWSEEDYMKLTVNEALDYIFQRI